MCRESRFEVLRSYSQIQFDGPSGDITFISWPRDTIFLDLPGDSRNVGVDDIMDICEATFRPVQLLAVRVRTHVFWSFPNFLRRAKHLQKLVFVDEVNKEPFPHSTTVNLYLMDLGSLGFIRGFNVE